MKNPILSICISTYNREPSLKQLLENIVSQKGFKEDIIEICIVNDPSQNPDDNTVWMIAEFQKRYTNIHFHRNSIRAGMIPSILQVAQMWTGEYVWLFSDDDVIHPDALEIMVKTLRNQNPGLILNKFLWFEWDIPPLDKSNLVNGNTSIVHGMEELFEYLSDVAYSIDGYMMHCSLFCFRRDIFVNNLQNLLVQEGEVYMDTLKKDYFWHVRIVYTLFWNTEKIVILEKDLVLLRGGNISWSFVFKVCTDYRDLYLELSRRYKINKKTLKKMRVLYYYSVFTYIVIVYIQKYIPKRLYNLCVDLWKKIVRIIKIG
jgi:glycosyltransferase involved in cell wall biosynthesis